MTRIVLGTLLVSALVRCAPEEEPSPVVAACHDACGKLACTADVTTDCADYCETVGGRAEELGEPCESDLVRLFECHESLSCAEYVEWYDEVPGAPCVEEEAAVAANCPGVTLR